MSKNKNLSKLGDLNQPVNEWLAQAVVCVAEQIKQGKSNSISFNLHGAKLELTVKSCPGLELSSQIKQYVRLKKDGTYEFSSGNPPLKHDDVAIFDCEDSINADLAKEFFK